MARLPTHRPEPRDLPCQPRQRRGARSARSGQEAPAPFGQILQDRSRFEDSDRRASPRRILVDDRGQLVIGVDPPEALAQLRSEEHTSELQSLMRISYAVFCLKKKNKKTVADARIINIT